MIFGKMERKECSFGKLERYETFSLDGKPTDVLAFYSPKT